MASGLYGKLPAKRDFVVSDVPRDVLRLWEPWIQGGVSASQLALGAAWQERFFSAPIWRFWLGRRLMGVEAIGAFMPSVDGIGRAFPLTVVCPADPDTRLASPAQDAQEPWFDAVEALLLAALDGPAYEATLDGLAALPAPALAGDPASRLALVPVGRNAVGLALEPGGSFEGAFAALGAAGDRRRFEDASLWWTIGGATTPAGAFMADGLPEADAFAAFLDPPFPARAVPEADAP